MVFGKHINRYYLRYAGWLILGVITLFVVDYMQLLIPNIYQMLVNGINSGMVEVDGVLLPFDKDFLLDRICMPFLVIILVIVLGRFLWRVCFFYSGIKVEHDLRNRMFDNAKGLSMQYYQKNKVGSLMSLFTNDLDTVQECFGWGIMMFVDAIVLGTMAIIKMWGMNFILALLSLFPMILLLSVATIVGKQMMKRWDARQEAYARLSDFSQESFSGLFVIKAFVKETIELMAFKKLNKENEKVNVAHTRAAVLLRILVTLFVESVICIILGYGGYLVYQGIFNAGQLVEFIGYFTTIVWPIMAVSELIDMSSRGRASLKRISGLLDAKQDVFDKKDAKPLEDIKGKIEFKGLTFTYPGTGRKVLSDMSFVIEPGESVGLVGKTGSGKTTIVDLILRTYNVPDGTIFIDDHDVNKITIHSLRKGCAYVPQDNFLFSDTIANNISFGVDETDSEMIVFNAEMADLNSNIQEFNQGYDTILGERGVTVSGGQKQRISIARALIKDAPILIMDDSVSAVDTSTEKTILNNLKKIRNGKTTILIAHRISTIENMDKVIFIDDGKIVDIGRHDYLFDNCEAYRKMVELQQLEEEGRA